MLKSLHLKDFTVFQEASFTFGKNLNVIIGENGTGKTHILKAAYAAIAVGAARARSTTSDAPQKASLQIALADKLIGVFRAEGLGRLVRRKPPRRPCEGRP